MQSYRCKQIIARGIRVAIQLNSNNNYYLTTVDLMCIDN